VNRVLTRDELLLIAAAWLLGASRADSEDLCRVVDRSETVMLRHARRPRFDFVARNLNGIAALSADQVVMVLAGATLPVDGFTVGRAQNIDLARAREGLEISVHRRQTDAPPLGLELVVKLLRRSEPLSGA